MRIHTFPLTCDVCGGHGAATIQTAGAAWTPGVRIAHTDPDVCRANLERRAEALERREKEPEAA